MTSDNRENTLVGFSILSGISLLSIFGIMYYSTNIPSYLYLAIIMTPVLIYIGIGIIAQLAILPAVYFYFRSSEEVKSYFEPVP